MKVWVSMIVSNPREYKQCHQCRAISIKQARKCHCCKGKRFTIVTKDKIKNLRELMDTNGDTQIEVSN
jgi:hypothetical protein